MLFDQMAVVTTIQGVYLPPRQDKYSSKVYKYFVDFSETEAQEKKYSETDRHQSTSNEASLYIHFNNIDFHFQVIYANLGTDIVV